MYVCICNGVTDRQIREATEAGCSSVSESTMRPGLGSTCGSCLPLADAIMAEKRREESIRQQGFWIVRWDWDLAWRPEALASLLRRAMQWQRRSS